MSEIPVFDLVLIGWTIVAVVVFVVLLMRPAPYGRYTTVAWGPTLPHRPAWIVMESLSPLALVGSYVVANGSSTAGAGLFLAIWILHYLNRSIIYPLRASWGGRRMPLILMLSACLFNLINGSLNGFYFATAGVEHTGWRFLTPTTLAGLILWFVGAGINLWSDDRLLRLRSGGEREYAIPFGGLFRLVSCPNYLGECIEWCGFALLTGSPAALTFAIWTAANLIPRALSHHNWYMERFPGYPVNRRAMIPGIL